MEQLRNELFNMKDEFVRMLKQASFGQILMIIDNICLEYIREYIDYDYYPEVTPYDAAVSETYQIPYVNASFVSIGENRYIACQEPKYE